METKVLYTKNGNPKGIEGPMTKLKEKGVKIGPKFVIKNQRIIRGI